jgi:hypothetical protein
VRSRQHGRCGVAAVAQGHGASLGQDWLRRGEILRGWFTRRLPSYSWPGRASSPTAEIEEERRLLHVAMTRAKNSLHLVVPQRFFTHGQSAQGDRHVYAARTRFIPAALLSLFECTTWPIVVAAAFDRADPRQVRLDVGARMRSMWR